VLRIDLRFRECAQYIGRDRLLIDSEDFAVAFLFFYKAVAVAKLGLSIIWPVRFQFVGPAFATRLAKKTSIACAIDPTVRARQLSDFMCSRSSLFEA
jgi:hypothetical protein